MLDWSTHAHDYQVRAAAHLWNSHEHNGAAALWLDPGYGKTATVLHTFKAMVDAGRASQMLVVAPMRVMQTVWMQEIEEWSSLRGLRAAQLHGTKKEKKLKQRDINVWLINYEGIPWLVEMVKGGKVQKPWDVIVFDEIRRMKNAQGKRFKAMRPLSAMAKYRWGLTGTPASNGYMDLFGQFLIIDQGATLGSRITHFREEFFEKGWDGFTYQLRPGAADRIEERIDPLVFRPQGELDLPDFIEDQRVIVLESKARKQYADLKKTLVTDMGDTIITAANAAVLVGKLKQMANGRVYNEKHEIIHVHDAKAEALAELVEELGDEQLLIAVEYRHDLDQIKAVLGDRVRHFADCKTTAQAIELQDAWNAREVQFIADHPGSIGHGLNLQKGGAHHILWWGPTFDLDFYIQFNDRLLRQGNKSSAVVVHTFITENTVDDRAREARQGKETLQSALLLALTAELGTGMNNTSPTNHGDHVMTTLQFQPDSAQGQPAAAPGANPFAAAGAAAAKPAAAPQAAANPFAAAAPAPQPAPAAAPVAQPVATPQPGDTPAPQPAPTTAAAPPPANPFAAAQDMTPAAPAETQQTKIMQDVAAPAPAQPAAAPQPVQQAPTTPAPVIEDAQVVDNDAPAPVEAVEHAVGAMVGHVEAAVAGAAGHVPLFLHVPVDKMEKVLAAIARALK